MSRRPPTPPGNDPGTNIDMTGGPVSLIMAGLGLVAIGILIGVAL